MKIGQKIFLTLFSPHSADDSWTRFKVRFVVNIIHANNGKSSVKYCKTSGSASHDISIQKIIPFQFIGLSTSKEKPSLGQLVVRSWIIIIPNLRHWFMLITSLFNAFRFEYSFCFILLRAFTIVSCWFFVHYGYLPNLSNIQCILSFQAYCHCFVNIFFRNSIVFQRRNQYNFYPNIVHLNVCCILSFCFDAMHNTV